jgi:hypothetical protein
LLRLPLADFNARTEVRYPLKDEGVETLNARVSAKTNLRTVRGVSRLSF